MKYVKEDLSDGLKRCLTKKKISDISVSDICNETGVSRQTFYRHFRDKEDLINWSIDVILENSFKHMGKGVSLNDALNRKLDYIKEERVLFNKAFKMDNQNNCLLYTSPSPRDGLLSRMPSSA